MSERSATMIAVRTWMLSGMLGVSAVLLAPACTNRSSLPFGEQVGCYDAIRLEVVDPSGRTGPISGELTTAFERLPFECPSNDPFLGRGCRVDHRIDLGFGSAVGHRDFGRSPGSLRLVVRAHPNLYAQGVAPEAPLWEGEISTDFLLGSRTETRFGCLTQEIQVSSSEPLPPWPESAAMPQAESRCGPDLGVPAVDHQCDDVRGSIEHGMPDSGLGPPDAE